MRQLIQDVFAAVAAGEKVDEHHNYHDSDDDRWEKGEERAAFARCAERAIATTKVAVAANRAVRPLLAWCAEGVDGKVCAPETRLLGEARAHTTLGRRRPVVLPPVAGCQWQVLHPGVGSRAVHARGAIHTGEIAGSIVHSFIAATVGQASGTHTVSRGADGAGCTLCRASRAKLSDRAFLARQNVGGVAALATHHARWRLLRAARGRKVAGRGRRTITSAREVVGVGVGARGAREGDGAALRTVVRLWASYRLHSFLATTAGETGGAKSRASGTGLLTRDVHHLANQVWGGAPVARLVGGGGLAGTRWAAGVDIVGGVRHAGGVQRRLVRQAWYLRAPSGLAWLPRA
eukprot:scaffold26581_cov60-Phaeocystis_antarctica.AAC.5